MKQPTTEELDRYHVNKGVDRVTGDEETTAFRRTARLHQARWRESMSLPEGSHPMRSGRKRPQSPLGSRIEIDHALDTGSNFITKAASDAASWRVAHPEPKQTLDVDRLYSDLLSSMPMCFNLFGPLWADRACAETTVSTCWPDAPGSVSEVRFEWSPGRQLPGRFLENRSAFDAAVELDLENGASGIIGIETKYHENCRPERVPSDERMARYREVSEKSGVFVSGAVEAIVGTPLQQIWLDHLLALSMLQDEQSHYVWARFVLVHPARNPSYARAAADYASFLLDSSTFEVKTIETLLECADLPHAAAEAFKARYIW